MKRIEFSNGEEDFSALRVYSIVKRERGQKRFLARPPFSWPPQKKPLAVFDGGQKREDDKK